MNAPTAETTDPAPPEASAAAAPAADLAPTPAAAPAPAPAAPDAHLLTLQAHANYLGLAEVLTDDVIDIWNRFRPITDSNALKSLAHSLLTAAALFIGR